MRDIFVTVIVFWGLLLVFKNPHIGIYLWSWLSYMNPHRLGWGFAYDFPFAMIVGIVTIVSVLFSIKKLRFFWSPIIGWLLFFNFWMLLTTIFSLQPDESWAQWDKVAKIQLMTFVTLLVINNRERIHSLVWVIVLSIGFFGVKGGIFTLTSGGADHVLGPPASFLSGNTEVGLALVIILPLVRYLHLNTADPWIRKGLLISLLLIPVAILGTQSRGALLAIVAISVFLWLKSRNKLAPFIVILFMVPLLFLFMPQEWHDRMATMEQGHEVDRSAMGRVQAWRFAYTMAVSRPIGGGFEAFTPANYERFAPGLVDEGTGIYHDAHSIYFEILGEHGFVGLIVYLIIWFLSWKTAKKIMKLTRNSEKDKWAYDLASMLQVGMVGYAVGGAFLGLAYFDLGYHIIVILVLTLRVIEQEQQSDLNSIPLPSHIQTPSTKHVTGDKL